ncbi:MAG: DUF885 family protein [Armatimonadota bacterium]|nr:DUF885 family protein [Armatimonadota bacterium]
MTAHGASRAPALGAAVEAFLQWYYRHQPVTATFIGVHEADHRLPDFAEAATEQALSAVDSLLRQFRSLPDEPRTDTEALDGTVAQGALDVLRWELQSDHFHRGNPCVYTSEAIFGVLALFLRPFAPLAQRAEAARARLLAIPDFLAQGRRNVRRAPSAWTERAIRECRGALAFLERGLGQLMRDEHLHDPRLLDAAAAAAAAFRRHRVYLETELLKQSHHGYACGADALDLLLRRGHFLDMDAADVEAMAEDALQRALEARRSAARVLGAASWQEAMTWVEDRHPPVERYYARYTQVWEEARAVALAHRLVSWPDYPLRFVPQPAWAREAAPDLYFLSYRAPAAFDTIPVVDYLVNPVEPDMPPDEQRRRLRAANESAIKLNHVVHHAGLGHHVQNWYAYHRTASRIGQIAAADCASRIALFCGGTMAEGWACYATDLMEEVGFFDPLDRLALAHTRVRMAARAAVDVRLHTGRWSIADAVACYRDQAGMAPEAARAEAVRNSLFPGTALMYLVGNELIHRLRRQLAGQPGFDLCRFHDRFLSYGSLPVSLISRAMTDQPPLPG